MSENKKIAIDISIFKGLQALSNASFPKKCAMCGKRYETVDEYLSETESIRHSSGLKESFDDEENPTVEVFRNCVCGSTLMDVFNNRRDLSNVGLKRRKKFSELLDRLTNAGFSAETAREELLKIMSGEGSKLLNVKRTDQNSPKKATLQ